jgi:hypothetical protein
MGPDVPDQGYRCAIYVNGDRVYGAYGSVALDDESAKISTPGNFTCGTIICDLCYLQGVKNGMFIPPDPIPDSPMDNVWFIARDFKYFSLLCTYEAWVFHAWHDGARYTPEPSLKCTFQCIGYPEKSDIGDESHEGCEEILAQPEVVKLRQAITAAFMSI